MSEDEEASHVLDHPIVRGRRVIKLHVQRQLVPPPALEREIATAEGDTVHGITDDVWRAVAEFVCRFWEVGVYYGSGSGRELAVGQWWREDRGECRRQTPTGTGTYLPLHHHHATSTSH